MKVWCNWKAEMELVRCYEWRSSWENYRWAGDCQRVVIAKGRKSQDPCQNCLETGACGVSFNLLTSVTTRGFCGPPKWGKLRVHLLSPSHFKLAGHLHDVAKVASKKINYYLILKICNPELGPRRWLFRLTFSLYCSASALRNFYPLKKVTADKKTKFWHLLHFWRKPVRLHLIILHLQSLSWRSCINILLLGKICRI